MKDLGPLSYFLGIKVDHLYTQLHLIQSKYIVNLSHRSRMARAKPCTTPIASGLKLTRYAGDPLLDDT